MQTHILNVHPRVMSKNNSTLCHWVSLPTQTHIPHKHTSHTNKHFTQTHTLSVNQRCHCRWQNTFTKSISFKTNSKADENTRQGWIPSWNSVPKHLTLCLQSGKTNCILCTYMSIWTRTTAFRSLNSNPGPFQKPQHHRAVLQLSCIVNCDLCWSENSDGALNTF